LIVTLRPLSTPHFEALGKSKSLQKISIASSGVTDAQLRCLIEIPSLQFLWFSASDLKGTVPQSAIEALLTKHPNLTLRCSNSRKGNDDWWQNLQKRFPESKIERW
jgi:hypothetical protein